MSLVSRIFQQNRSVPTSVPEQQAAEIKHWNEIAQRARSGERLFWLNHPKVQELHARKGKIEGLDWREWAKRKLAGLAEAALELGCGQGLTIESLVNSGYARSGVGVDLHASRFAARPSDVLELRAGDVNYIQLEENRYDLIYSLQSFHHFERLEHVMEQINRALTPRGFFVLDEFVGPARFQWTDLQLSITADLLALLPQSLRFYANGMEKRSQGRSSPEEVIRVCPSEAIRSDEIVPLFYKYFDVLHANRLGGTVQHLLYAGIIQNFPDHDPQVDRMIESIEALETRFIEGGLLRSDFVLLVGKKRD